MGKPMATVITKVTAPWDRKTVQRLNAMQGDHRMHGFTCPGNHSICKGQRLLVATRQGWVCQCGRYTQEWAIFHDDL